MSYKATFDESGNRTATYIVGFHTNIPTDAIEITAAEQEKYMTGNYVRDTSTGELTEKTAAELTIEEKLVSIRLKRNKLLTDSDKYILSDYPISDTVRESWKTYRQKLRDFPSVCDVDNPVWPIAPTV